MHETARADHSLVRLGDGVWQHGSGEWWACVVPVRGLSVATLLNPAGGHLAGRHSLFVHQALAAAPEPDGGSGGPVPFQVSPAGLCAL